MFKSAKVTLAVSFCTQAPLCPSALTEDRESWDIEFKKHFRRYQPFEHAGALYVHGDASCNTRVRQCDAAAARSRDAKGHTHGHVSFY